MGEIFLNSVPPSDCGPLANPLEWNHRGQLAKHQILESEGKAAKPSRRTGTRSKSPILLRSRGGGVGASTSGNAVQPLPGGSRPAAAGGQCASSKYFGGAGKRSIEFQKKKKKKAQTPTAPGGRARAMGALWLRERVEDAGKEVKWPPAAARRRRGSGGGRSS